MNQIRHYNTMDLPQSLYVYAEKAYGPYGADHDLAHAMTVLTNSRRIIAEEGLDLSPGEYLVSLAAALGHDIHDHKLENTAVTREDTRQAFAEAFDETTADALFLLWDNCSWSKRKSHAGLPDTVFQGQTVRWELIRTVLCDADWLEAMKLDRCLAYTAGLGLRGTDFVNAVKTHIREKLIVIPNDFVYETTGMIAKESGYEKILAEYLEGN